MIHYVNDGETSSGIVLDYDALVVLSGGVVKNTEIKNSGYVDVSSGGKADSTIINDGDTGGLFIFDGGVANDVTVNSGGFVKVTSGGKAKNVVENGGYVYIPDELENGHPNVTFKKNSFSGVVLHDAERKASVHSGTTAIDTTVDSDGAFRVLGGIANGTTVNSGGEMDVYSGKANSTTVNENGILWIKSGGTMNSAAVNSGGYVGISSGGKAKNVVENGGYVYIVDELENGHPNVTFKKNSFSGVVLTGDGTGKKRNASVHSGTTAADTTVNSDGHLEVLGGIADGNTVNSGGNMYVLYGTANNTVVNSGGFLDIDSKGIANGVTANSSGSVHVSSGGVVNSVTVNSGGHLNISAGGTATGVVENGGYVYVEEGAEVTFLPNTFSGVVLNGIDASVHSGTIANDTVVNSDSILQVFSGGFANGVTVNKDGKLWVYEGGLVNGFTVGAGGELNVGYGGWITGRMTFEAGAIVTPDTMGTLDFDLTQTAPGEAALVNDLSFIPDTFAFTLTVNGAQPDGTYKLAGGAAGFDQTVYVFNTSGKTLGTLTVGGSLSTGMADYTLKKNGSVLTVDVVAKVTENGPPEPYNDDLYYKKTKSVNTKVTESWGTHLGAPGDEIYLDKIGTVDEKVRGVTYSNHVEKQVNKVGDKIDYAKIVLAHGAKLSFHAEASAAATFTVYSLTQNKKGKYSLKKLQTLKLKDKDNDGKFTADSKKLLQLQTSGAYYVAMKYTDKRKTVSDAYYNVWLNDNSEFEPYSRGDNTDDWGDRKTAGWGGAVADLGTVDAARLAADKTVIKDEWIGFGDKFDYKKFTLADAAQLDFTVSAPDGPLKLSVCKLKEKTKKGVTTYSMITVKTVKLKVNQGAAQMDGLRLEADDYFIKVESTNIKKSTGYDVRITGSTFFTDGDGGGNNALLDGKKLNENAGYFYDNKLSVEGGSIHLDKAGNYKTSKTAAEYMFEGKPYGGFVGFGDEADFAKLTLSGTADVTFSLTATNDATLEIVKVTQSGTKYTKKLLQTVKYKQGSDTATSKKAVHLEIKDGVSYYVSVKTANTKKASVDPRTYYNVTYAMDSYETAALAMLETSDALAMTDRLSFGQYEAGALPDATASFLAELESSTATQPLALLG